MTFNKDKVKVVPSASKISINTGIFFSVLSITKQVAIKQALGLLNLVLNLIDLPQAKVVKIAAHSILR